MSTQDDDGIDEALQQTVHAVLTVAGRLGEQLARAREQQARQAQAHSQHAAQELAARVNAEREAARASLSVVHQDQWWDRATTQEVATAYSTARAWRDLDAEAGRAEQRIVQEVRTRYGVDVARTDPAGLAEALTQADQARSEAAQERAGAGRDRAHADRLMNQADEVDRAAEADLRREDPEQGPASDVEGQREQGPRPSGAGSDPVVEYEAERGRAEQLRQDAGPVWDSAQRREATAHSLDGVADQAVVDARMRSDVAQGRPATAATSKTPGRAAPARPARSTPRAARTVQRPGLSR